MYPVGSVFFAIISFLFKGQTEVYHVLFQWLKEYVKRRSALRPFLSQSASCIVGPVGIEPTASAFTAQPVCLGFSAPKTHLQKEHMGSVMTPYIPPSCEDPSIASPTVPGV